MGGGVGGGGEGGGRMGEGVGGGEGGGVEEGRGRMKDDVEGCTSCNELAVPTVLVAIM